MQLCKAMAHLLIMVIAYVQIVCIETIHKEIVVIVLKAIMQNPKAAHNVIVIV